MSEGINSDMTTEEVTSKMSGKIFLQTDRCDSVLSTNLINFKCCNLALTDIDLTCSTTDQNIITHERFYICCDIVKESPLQILNQEIRYFPILRPVHLSGNCSHSTTTGTTNVTQSDACLNTTYSFPYFIAARRTEVESFRLYLIDAQGNIPSFNNFQLKCTLVYKRA